MANPFLNYSDAIDAPARNVLLITPSDSVELSTMLKAIRADTSGVIVFRTIDATADVAMNVSAGETLPYRVRYIRATGTTATIHGLA